MKKRISIYLLIISIMLSCFPLLMNDISHNEVQSYITKKTSPILSNGIDITDEWYHTYGFPGYDIAYDVVVSSSGYIFLAGSVSYQANVLTPFVLVCNNYGGEQIGHGGGSFTHDSHLYAITADSSGNVIVGGDYFGDCSGLYHMTLWKFNSTGGHIWSSSWGGNTDAKCYGITVDLSDNIYIVGEVQNSSTGTSDMCLVKYNSDGIEQWNRTWGGLYPDQCYDVAVNSSGDIYLAGNTWSYGLGCSNICLVKFNSSGDYKWNKTWGGSSYDYCTSIALDSFGNIYLAGYSFSFITGFPKYSDMCLIKYNSSGDQQWNRTWGGAGFDKCFDIELDSIGNIYVGGESVSDMCLIKYNSSGDEQWNTTWGGDGIDSCRGITIDSLGNIYLAGETESYASYGGSDMCFVKYSSKPKIAIISPKEFEYYGKIAPDFELSIFEPDLNKIWYTIDDGKTNFSCYSNGQIDQSEWDDKEDGLFLIRFYAEDTKKNIGISEVWVYKDTVAPTIYINEPVSKTRYNNKPPIFYIKVYDNVGLNSTWYSINGLRNSSIYINNPDISNALCGYISESDWNDTPKGKVDITFYAQDVVGNIASESVIIYKGSESEPFIPGYNLFLIIGIISVVSIIPIMKLKKSKQ